MKTLLLFESTDFFSPFAFLLIIGFLAAFVFIMRFIGSWMLRIDEVIGLLRDIKALMSSSKSSETISPETKNDEK